MRLHCHHGPIDLIVDVSASQDEIARAYQQVQTRFETVLEELVAELPLLRTAYNPRNRFSGETANRMQSAIAPMDHVFVTPMAAVAGSVADTVLTSLLHERCIDRAYVNNGGDIALYLKEAQVFRIALVAGQSGERINGYVDIKAEDRVGGIATSGWQGRSLSLGIADAVTVLARDGAAADAAATVIANAIDVPGSERVQRARACDVFDDSDLGDRLVTVGVEPLTAVEIDSAIEAGLMTAKDLLKRHVIVAAYLCLQGSHRVIGNPLLSMQHELTR